MSSKVLDVVFLVIAVVGLGLMLATALWDVSPWIPATTLTGVGAAGILLRKGRLGGTSKPE